VVEVGEDRRVAEGPTTGRSIDTEAGDLAPIHEEVVLASKARSDAESSERIGNEAPKAREERTRRRCSLGHNERDTELSCTHENGAATRGTPPEGEAESLHGAEIEFGCGSLVASNEDGVVAVGVAAQDGFVLRTLGERVVESEPSCCPSVTVEEDA